MVSRRDYSDEIVEAARSVQLEVIRILGEYQDDIVIVGGWVPELLILDAEEKHIGSSDVDLALNHRKISEACYKTILEHLMSNGYKEGEQPFTFERIVTMGDQEYLAEVHFLAGEPEAGKSCSCCGLLQTPARHPFRATFPPVFLDRSHNRQLWLP
jgi:hypothetical protein